MCNALPDDYWVLELDFSRSNKLINQLGSLVLPSREDVTIDIARDRGSRMTQPAGKYDHRHIMIQHQTRRGVPEVMEAKGRKSGLH